MNVEYKSTREGVQWERISHIFDQVGWGPRPPDKVELAFNNSSFVRFAYSDGELVGFSERR